MNGRTERVSATDLALLQAVARVRSVAGASRQVGISRDGAVYRLTRLERAFGGPVVVSERGGRDFGGSLLTPLGDRIARRGFDSLELLGSRPATPPPRSNVLRGTYRAFPSPELFVPPDLHLQVAFSARDGEPTTVLLDPPSILVARARFATSARNVIPATVLSARRAAGEPGWTALTRAGGLTLRVAVTRDAVRQLRLRAGSAVWLYVKATALRPIITDRVRRRMQPRRR